MTDLRGATVLVTGAASGIGALVAGQCVARGARVIGWDVADIALDGVESVRCDLSSRAQIEQAAAATGAIDVLVNNAGVVSGRLLVELTAEQIERTFAVNALAPIWTTRAFLPGMLERRRGHVVNVSSAAAIAATSRLSDYAASKWALAGFDEALRLELARMGSPVRTTIVCPFYVNTGLFAGVKTRVPWLLPILEPDDVARRIVAAIETNQRRVVMPWFVRTAYVARALPIGVFDQLMRVFGINRSMDEFTGRHP